MNYISIDTLDLAIASVLVILNAGLSLALNLQLERQFLIATIRMIVQ